MSENWTMDYHNIQVGCYCALSDMWIITMLYTRKPPMHSVRFRLGKGLFKFWKYGYNDRLLYKLESIIDE